MSTDTIQKQITLRAPPSRVWRALTDTEELGKWFGAKLEKAPFTRGTRITGPITHKGYENLKFDATVEMVEPEFMLSWRWHPAPTDPAADYSSEPTTRVSFEFEEDPQGTRLTMIESGFDALPASRRAEAYRMNEEGWGQVLDTLAKGIAQ